jgi:AcrR family transcriptional regulator
MSDTGQIDGFDHEKAAALFEASEPGVDRRARRTRLALHQTLMRLIVERGYEAITVADIAEGANVGRSTFYAHFTDKDDLLRSAAANLRVIVLQQHAVEGLRSMVPEARVLGFSHFMTHHLYEQRRLFHALMKGQAGAIVLEVIGKVLREIVRDELKTLGLPAQGQPSREIVTQFIVGSYEAVVTSWLERGAREKPEAVNSGFLTLALSGLSTLRAPRAT